MNKRRASHQINVGFYTTSLVGTLTIAGGFINQLRYLASWQTVFVAALLVVMLTVTAYSGVKLLLVTPEPHDGPPDDHGEDNDERS